MNNHSGVIFHS